MVSRVGVVGTGLVGTSVGLALAGAGVEVLLRDSDAEQVRVAVALGAGRPWREGERVEHAVVAVPPHVVAPVLRDVQRAGAAATASDVASVKTTPVAEAAALDVDLSTWCPAHPVAGRERGGAASARADLFRDRPWVLCPTTETSSAALAAAEAVAAACGATLVRMTPARHDAAMARLSHVPQVVASLLAGVGGRLDDDEIALAGTGFRDTTRLADSDPALWASILEGNREPVAAALESLATVLGRLASVLRTGSASDVGAAVTAVMAEGRAARLRLPIKGGRAAPDWAWVGVVVPDVVGGMARILAAVARWEVNVEDVRVEHDRSRPAGVLELAVAPPVADDLQGKLTAAGWTAYRRA